MSQSDIENSYNNIINILKLHKIKSESLVKIKSAFQTEIDSPRRLHSIRSLSDIIEILESRFLLRSHNISLIKKILDECKIQEINEHIINHHKLLIEYNYALNPVKDDNANVLNEKVFTDHVVPITVVEKISSNIGNSWKNLAKELGFNDNEIEDIDKNWNDIPAKSKKMLETYLLSNENNGNIREHLVNALLCIRHRRLMNEVENIFLKTCDKCRLPMDLDYKFTNIS